jgi:TPR repeat protein
VRDQDTTMELFRQAGDAEVGPSLRALGVISLRGNASAPGAVEAVRYFEAASAIGHGPSTYNLALAHLTKIGGADDPILGMELLEVTAEGDLAQA